MREIGGIPAEDWQEKRADAAQLKLKTLREGLEKRVAALEARPQGVTQATLSKHIEATVKGIAPAILESIAEHTAKAMATLRKENEALTRRIVFLEGRASAERSQ